MKLGVPVGRFLPLSRRLGKYLKSQFCRSYTPAVYLAVGFSVLAIHSQALDGSSEIRIEFQNQFGRTVRHSYPVGELRYSQQIYAYINKKMRRASPKTKLKLQKLVESLARQYQFHPGLILAVIKVESGFDPLAVSSQGAMGLMQLMPDTAEYIAPQCKVKLNGLKQLFDIEKNVTLGVCYLSYLRSMYGNNLEKILSAYNRGPARVAKDLTRGRNLVLGYYNKVKEEFPDLQTL